MLYNLSHVCQARVSMTLARHLRDYAAVSAVEFSRGTNPHEVAERLCQTRDGFFDVDLAAKVYVALCIADALDPGKRADLISQIRARLPK